MNSKLVQQVDDVGLLNLNVEVSIRDLILLAGGLFLLFKSTMEINHKMERLGADPHVKGTSNTFNIILQIILLDIFFQFVLVFFV